MKKRQRNSNNNTKLVLPIASQMLGSGKTWFGRFLLKSLAKNKDKLTQFDQTELNYLASSHHVLLDMRDISKPYTTQKLVYLLLDSLIFFSPVDLQNEALKYWVNRPLAEISLQSVGGWFRCKLCVPILFHFDEVDAIAAPSSPVRKLLFIVFRLNV